MGSSFVLSILVAVVAMAAVFWAFQEMAHSRREATEQNRIDGLSWSLCHQTKNGLETAVRDGNRKIKALQTTMSLWAGVCGGAGVLVPKLLAACRAVFSASIPIVHALEKTQSEMILLAWPVSHTELRWRLNSENQFKVFDLKLEVSHDLRRKWDSSTQSSVPNAYHRVLSPVHTAAQESMRALLVNPKIRWPYHLERASDRTLYQNRILFRPTRYQAQSKRSYKATALQSGCRVVEDANGDFEVLRK
jgi:hypothetical protein